MELQQVDAAWQCAEIGTFDDALRHENAAVVARTPNLGHDVVAATSSLCVARTLLLEQVVTSRFQDSADIDQLVFANHTTVDTLRKVPIARIWDALLHGNESNALGIVGSDAATGEALPTHRNRIASISLVVRRHI